MFLLKDPKTGYYTQLGVPEKPSTNGSGPYKIVGRLGGVHGPEYCAGDRCAIHGDPQHPMSEFPRLWRQDRGIVERICPHGIGHPDPGQYDYWATVYADDAMALSAQMMHGCDGCCAGSYGEESAVW